MMYAGSLFGRVVLTAPKGGSIVIRKRSVVPALSLSAGGNSFVVAERFGLDIPSLKLCG